MREDQSASGNFGSPSFEAKDKSERMRLITALGTSSDVLRSMRLRKQKERPQLPTPLVLPSTATERKLAEIWSEVIGVSVVGMHDNFFQLGGDSLMITQIAFRVREDFGIDLPMHSIFQSPTVAGLSSALADIGSRADESQERDLKEFIDQLSDEEVQAALERIEQETFTTDDFEPANTSSAPALTDGQSYRVADVELYRAGRGMAWAYCRDNHKSLMLDAETASMIDQWHRSALTPDVNDPRVTGLRASGFLVSESECLRPFAEFFYDHPEEEISTVGCVTRDRVSAAVRALSSYILHCRQYERKPSFLVLDDSEAVETREEYRTALASLRKDHAARIYYAGKTEKLQLKERLVEGGLPSGVVDFALFGLGKTGLGTYGANRNALLLATIGQRVLSVDDDTVCRIIAPPIQQSGLRLIGGTEAPHALTDLWAFPDRETAIRSFRFVDTDLLGEHKRFLGCKVGACVGEAVPNGVDLRFAGAGFLRQLAKPRATVRISLNGVGGDCGWGSPFNYLLLSGDSRARICDSEARYREIVTSRETLQVAPSPTISRSSDRMMSTVFAYDHSELLPPFAPVGRGSDHLFATTLSRCDATACFAHLPWALLHLPAEARRFWSDEAFRSAAGIDISLLISSLIDSFEFGSDMCDCRSRLMRLGKYLQEISSLDAEDFNELVRVAVCRNRARLISQLEDSIDPQLLPEFWRRDVDRFTGEARKSLLRPDIHIPLDILYCAATSDARVLTQTLVNRMGELFFWWPEIVQTARKVQVRDAGFLIPV